SQLLREWLGQQVRLVVAAFLFSHAVQGHRHHNVRSQFFRLPVHKLNKPRREPGTPPLEPLKLQQEGRPYERPVRKCKAARVIKGVRLVLACRTETPLRVPARETWQGHTADVTNLSRDRLKRRQAIIANGHAARAGQDLVADTASTGEKQA